MAGGAVGGEVCLPAFDMIFRLAAGGIELLIKPLPSTVTQVADDEPGVRPLWLESAARSGAGVPGSRCPWAALPGIDGSDELPVLVEHDDQLETVLVIMSVELAQLLLAINGVEGVTNIQHDPFRHLPDPGAVEIDQRATHAQQGTGIGQVLQARNGGLRAQAGTARQTAAA